MSRVLAVCFPVADLSFGERVRRFVEQDRWDLASPTGIALMQALLRESYPLATVRPETRRLDGGWHPAVVLDVYRDGTPVAAGSRAASSAVPGWRRKTGQGTTPGGLEGSRPAATARLRPALREAMELAGFEGLALGEIAERMQTTAAVVDRLLEGASASTASGVMRSVAMVLADWRAAVRSWEQLQADSPERLAHAIDVAHVWLEYQVVTGAIAPEDIVLVTDSHRRYVAVSANAALLLGRTSLVGLRVEDVSVASDRPLVPGRWATFLAAGSTEGEYECDRPGQAPIRVSFRAFSDRPLPGLQVSYLRPLATASRGSPVPA